MVVKIHCECGNTDINRTSTYNGTGGYTAVICNCCGRYWDGGKTNEADDWSNQFVMEKK